MRLYGVWVRECVCTCVRALYAYMCWHSSHTALLLPLRKQHACALSLSSDTPVGFGMSSFWLPGWLAGKGLVAILDWTPSCHLSCCPTNQYDMRLPLSTMLCELCVVPNSGCMLPARVATTHSACLRTKPGKELRALLQSAANDVCAAAIVAPLLLLPMHVLRCCSRS
jgi:hypothetical protein